MRGGAFLERCVRDIKTLLADESHDVVAYGPEAFDDADVVMLWDAVDRPVPGGTSYDDDLG